MKTLKIPNILILIVLIAGVIIPAFLSDTQDINAVSWLDSNWQYRKLLTINGSQDGIQANYQVKFNIAKDWWNNWIPEGNNPVLASTQSWSKIGGISAIYSPTLLYENSTYKLWYGGAMSGHDQIGYATSVDGISWTQYAGNPVVTYGTGWDSLFANDPSVVKVGSNYYMFYTGCANYNGQYNEIGLATSTDGISWTKYASNPILPMGYSEDEYYVWMPTVIYEDNTFKMWYLGTNHAWTISSLYYSTSSDGISWTRQGVTNLTNIGGFNPDIKALPNGGYILGGQAGNGINLYYGNSETNFTQKKTNVIELQSWNQNALSPAFLFANNEWWMVYAGATDGTGAHFSIGLAKNFKDTIFLNNCQDDFDDIRFTQNDGVTKYKLYTESIVSGKRAVIWGKVGSIPADNVTMYIYYGNTSASSESNGDDTFIFFDNFNTFPSAKWTGATSYGNATNGVLTYGDATANWRSINSSINSGKNTFAVRAYGNLDGSIGLYGAVDSGQKAYAYREGVTPTTYIMTSDGTTQTSTLTNLSIDSFKVVDILVCGGINTRIFENGKEVLGSPKENNIPNSSSMKAIIASYNVNPAVKMDWILLRNYTPNEPYLYSVGQEEQFTASVPTVVSNNSTFRLSGEITSTGGENPEVHIYWGTSDGGENPSSWQHDEDLGVKGLGDFYKDIDGLNNNMLYYFKCTATNSAGTSWSNTHSFILDNE